MQSLNFEYIQRHPNYDVLLNPEHENVFKLSPIGFQWQFNNIIYKYMFNSIGRCCALKDGNGFAIVDIDNTLKGKAFLLNVKGDIIFKLNRKDDIYRSDNYYDVFYENDQLCFIVNNNNADFKHIFDETINTTISVEYIRW